MAIDKRLQIYDEQGNLVDYDILASDVKFQPDGKDLPTKLAEMDDAIEDAGSGDGTVTGVKIGSTTYEPTDGVVDLSSPMSNKVDKNGTDSLMTAAEHTKLGNLPTATELATQMNSKANDNAVVKTISVNGGTPQTPVNGNVNISVEGGGSVESVTVSGTKYTPDINGDVNLGDLRGQDGNSGVASADGVESVNNLNGGTTDTQSKVYVLGANQGKRLRDQIDLIYQRMQTLYGLLGNIAFWEGKPSASALLPELDWGAPKHKVTLSLTLTNAVVKDSLGNTKVNGAEIQVEEGGTLTLTVEPASGYALTGAPTVSTGATVNDNGNGTYSVSITMGGSDMTLSISATAAQARSVTLNLTGCTKKSGPTSIINGGGGTFVFAANEGYTLPTSAPTVTNGTVTSWDSSTGTLVISGVSGNVTITVVATQVQTEDVNLTMKKVTAYGAQYGTAGNGDTANNTYKVPMTLANLNGSAPECSLSNTSYVDGQAFSATVIPATGYAIYSVKVMQNGNNITGTAYNPATRAISVASPDSSLAITVIVAAATNGMFKAGSLYGCRSGNASDIGESHDGTQLAGQIVTDPNWHCNSEFIAIPQGATHIKWWVSDAEHKPYSQNQSGCTVLCQRSMNFLDENLIPISFTTYNNATNPYRIFDMSSKPEVSSAKFLRASYVDGYGKIEFSSDGTNFSPAWEYTEE